MKGRNARQPCRDKYAGDMPKPQSPEANGITPENTRIGPQRTETGPPEEEATGPGIPGEDQGLHRIRDFMGFRTSWDSRLRGT